MTFMGRSNSRVGGTKLSGLLLISLGLNMALAWAGFKLWRKPVAAAVPAVSKFVILATNDALTLAGAVPSLCFVTNQFHWRRVESTNYEQYVANLRAIGCPEKTVRDIIVPAVDRHFETRRRETRQELPFWTGGRALRKAERLQAGHWRELEQEKTALIQHLLGIEGLGYHYNDRLSQFGDQWIRLLFGPVSEETYWKIGQLNEKFDDLFRELTSQTGGIQTDADEAALRELRDRRQVELQKLLSANEFQELAARSCAMLMFDNTNIQDVVALSPAEARQIALAGVGGNTDVSIFGSRPYESLRERELRERQFTNSVALLLGEKRFADFQHAQDNDFVKLYELAKENQLSKETAVAVYDMRQLTAQEVESLRNDSSLDATARQQKMEAMSGELQKAMSDVLGAAAYQKYLQGNGAWVTNLSHL